MINPQQIWFFLREWHREEVKPKRSGLAWTVAFVVSAMYAPLLVTAAVLLAATLDMGRKT